MTTNEIKRVSETEWSKAYQQMLADFKAQTGMDGYSRIMFHFDYDHDADSDLKPWKRPKVMQVNWAAIGTVTPDEAAKFGKALMIASKLAENFIYNGYRVYYED